jgi:hypothetical protein
MNELFASHSGKLVIGQAGKTLVVQVKGVASVELHLPAGGDVKVIEAIDYSEPPAPKAEPAKPAAAPERPPVKKQGAGKPKRKAAQRKR